MISARIGATTTQDASTNRRREKLFLHYFQYLSVSEHLRSSPAAGPKPG